MYRKHSNYFDVKIAISMYIHLEIENLISYMNKIVKEKCSASGYIFLSRYVIKTSTCCLWFLTHLKFPLDHKQDTCILAI